MRAPTYLKRPPWRTVVPVCAILVVCGVAYVLWSPGRVITDGRHDRGRNAIWLQHAWLGDDEWFLRQAREDEIPLFREPERITALASRLREHNITDVFPHVAPTRSTGDLPAIHAEQVTRFLAGVDDIRVMPWVGGVLGQHCFPEQAEWRQRFSVAVGSLLDKFPELAGIHVNIEPWPSGDASLLVLLDELRASLPTDKTLSVAAYPPPTIWHRHPDLHWDRAYFEEVSQRADQLAVMMYDTALRSSKFYRNLMADWTCEAIDWSGNTSVLLGLPAYDDADVGYHHPDVENLAHALAGIHEGLASYMVLPTHYQGVAIYSEWEMDEAEWEYFRKHFLARPPQIVP